MECSPPGSSVHGILQARTQERQSFPSAGDLPGPVTESRSSALQTDSLPSEPPGKPNLIKMQMGKFLSSVPHLF